MLTQKRKYLIVGAGPIGSIMALKLRERFPEVEIDIFDKRITPGERYEVLYIFGKTWNTFSKSLQYSLIKSEQDQNPKAILSSNVFDFFRNPFKLITNDPHLTVCIINLEKALHEEFKDQNIIYHQGLKFIDNFRANNEFFAVFEDINHQNIIKKYDEIIFAMGLSGVLKQNKLEHPRILHGFRTISALYKLDTVHHFDFSKFPSQLSYLAKWFILAGVTITPEYIAPYITVPRHIKDFENESQMINFLQKSINAIPKAYHHFIKYLDNPPFAIKVINANVSLAPILTYDSLHGHPIGDMVLTFPYVYGSETNFGITEYIPLLINHLDSIAQNPENRMKYNEQYCSKFKNLILNHECFSRLLPFTDTIYLGSKKFSPSSLLPIYHFPGWDALMKTSPSSTNNDFQYLPTNNVINRDYGNL